LRFSDLTKENMEEKLVLLMCRCSSVIVIV